MLCSTFKNIEQELEIVHEYLRKYFQKKNFSAQSQVIPMGIEYQDKKLDITAKFMCIRSDTTWTFRYSVEYDKLKGKRTAFIRGRSGRTYTSWSPPGSDDMSQTIEISIKDTPKETSKYIAARIIKTIAQLEKKALIKRL